MTVEKWSQDNQRFAFNKIKNEGPTRLLLLCDRLHSNLARDFSNDSFNRIKLIWKNSKFNQITAKIIAKHFYQ